VFITRIFIVVARLERRGGAALFVAYCLTFIYIYIYIYSTLLFIILGIKCSPW
jgi:hypothetical protein